jgi:phage-related tail protein
MAFGERIALTIDVLTGQSKSVLSRLKQDLAGAEGGVNKLKTVGKAGFDAFKQYATAAALGAGTAIVAFAAKAVGEFQRVALQAGELRDSLGVTSEEASRLAEVAGDLGVPVSALEASIGRMNRVASDSPEAFSQIGASIRKSADGAIDTNATFLSVIDTLHKMPNASDRAAAGYRIFGRSWMAVAEMVGMGADELQERLAGVDTGLVATDDDVRKARELRDSLDELGDMASSFAATVGSELVPALNDALDAFTAVTSVAGKTFQILQGDFDIPVLDKLVRYLNPVTGGLNAAHDAVTGLNKELSDARGIVHGVVGIILVDDGESAA